MINQDPLKIIIFLLVILLLVMGLYIAGIQITKMQEKAYNKGVTDGRINGSIDARNFILQDICYDGLITIGTDNETGRIIQVPLEDVCR